jgi:predicted DNA binding CopG/RHH family protein
MVTREQVIKRLTQLGYTATVEDNDHIDFELAKILNYVKNYCNITNIPEILDPRITDRVCSEFLFYKKNSGSLNGFNYETVIKSIKEGDTTLTYAVGQGEDTPENRFDSFVKSLERGFDKWITPYRRLRW